MNGYELARRLRGSATDSDTIHIALTGYGQAHDRAMSMASGFDHHFVKPLELADLESAVAARAGK
jgi:CheY-like chemotaxis protein